MKKGSKEWTYYWVKLNLEDFDLEKEVEVHLDVEDIASELVDIVEQALVVALKVNSFYDYCHSMMTYFVWDEFAGGCLYVIDLVSDEWEVPIVYVFVRIERLCLSLMTLLIVPIAVDCWKFDFEATVAFEIYENLWPCWLSIPSKTSYRCYSDQKNWKHLMSTILSLLFRTVVVDYYYYCRSTMAICDSDFSQQFLLFSNETFPVNELKIKKKGERQMSIFLVIFLIDFF